MWRVWFTNVEGELRWFDVDESFSTVAIQRAHELFRAEPGPDPMRGWWMKCWQPLVVTVTDAPGGCPAAPNKIKGPPLRRRLYVARRRWHKRRNR